MNSDLYALNNASDSECEVESKFAVKHVPNNSLCSGFVSPVRGSKKNATFHSFYNETQEVNTENDGNRRASHKEEQVRSAFNTTSTNNNSTIRCKVIGHEIQKKTSRHQQARVFQKLRKRIPDISKYCVVLLLEVYDSGDTHIVKRKYSQLKTIHNKLRRKFPRSNIQQNLPSMSIHRYDNAYIDATRKSLSLYIQHLIDIPEVVKSDMFRRFLEDTVLSDCSDDDNNLSASNTLLQSFPEVTVFIRKRQSYSVKFEIIIPGSVATWQFSTYKHDIAFGVKMNNVEVCPYAREESQLKDIRGCYVCREIGTCILTWDNSYSWSRGKRLTYRAELLDAQIITATEKVFLKEIEKQEDDEFNLTGQSFEYGVLSSSAVQLPITTATCNPKVITSSKNAPSQTGLGYLDIVKRQAISPTRLVLSSLSILRRRKNFLKGERCWKSGYLHVQREKKFRKLRWTSKWFALDSQKGVLLCFDREVKLEDMNYRVPRMKMYLTYSNTSLSVLGKLPNAPTSFCQSLESGRKRWNICAENENEYNEWREAISSAIFIIQCSKFRNHDFGGMENNNLDDEDDLTDSKFSGDQEGFEDDDEEEEIDDEDDDDDEDDEDGSEKGCNSSVSYRDQHFSYQNEQRCISHRLASFRRLSPSVLEKRIFAGALILIPKVNEKSEKKFRLLLLMNIGIVVTRYLPFIWMFLLLVVLNFQISMRIKRAYTIYENERKNLALFKNKNL